MKFLIIATASALASTADANATADATDPSLPSFARDRSLQGGGCSDCVVEGIGYCRFQSYPDPTCLPNVCRCRPGEVDPCTKNECTRNCAAQNKKVCAHDDNFYCAGDVFYDTSCMANTCTCNADGTVSCAKKTGDCKVECYTDDDCTTVLRTQSAQPDLYPLCGCEARSALWEIASSYDECLGQGIIGGSTCNNGQCDGNSCQGQKAVCVNRKCDLISPCKKDVKTCPGGAKVRRNAANNCEFDPCPEPPPSSNNEAGYEDESPSDSDPSDKPNFVFGKLCFDGSGDNYVAPCVTSTSSYCISETFTGDDGCSSCLCANSQGQTICNDDACLSAPPPTQPPKEFTYKREKMKTCEWLGKNPDEAIAIICKTRVKEPSARISCPQTCALSQVGRLAEAQNEYLHRKKTKKTCDWLKVREDRERICSKNRNARGNCPLEC